VQEAFAGVKKTGRGTAESLLTSENRGV
jgi:hypothetical protein